MTPNWQTARASDGAALPYNVVGEGPPLLLVPGLGNSSRLFGTLPRTLVRHGWKTILFDPRGLGRAKHEPRPWTFTNAIEDIATILDDVGIEATHVLGTSMGGKLALALGARYPGRVREAFLFGTESVGGARPRAVYEMFRTVFTSEQPERIATVLLPFLFGRTFLERHERVVRDILRAYAPSAEERATTLRQVDALLERDYRSLLPSVKARVTCHAGMEDTLVDPADIEVTASLLPNGVFCEVPAAGHSMILENPDVALAELRTRARGPLRGP